MLGLNQFTSGQDVNVDNFTLISVSAPFLVAGYPLARLGQWETSSVTTTLIADAIASSELGLRAYLK